MRTFIVKTVVFIALFFLMDRLAFVFIQSKRPSDYKLFLESKKDFFKQNHVVDILMIGDSHIADAVDTRRLEKCTGMNSYNLGVYHASPFENYHIMKAAFNHLSQKPKMVILGTNPVMFEKKLSKGTYTPLIIGNDLELVLNSKDGLDVNFFFKVFQEKYLLKHVFENIRGKEYKPTREIVNVYKGHLEFYNQIPDTEWENFEKKKESKINLQQVEYFRKTIQFLVDKQVKVIIMNPPIWRLQLNAISNTGSFWGFEKMLNKTAKEYGIDIYNSDNDILIEELKKDDFLNTQHLNYKGSQKFTTHFCDYLANSNK